MSFFSQKNRISLLLFFSLSVFFSSNSFAETTNSESFMQALELLQSKSYNDKGKAIEQLVTTKDERVQSILYSKLSAN